MKRISLAAVVLISVMGVGGCTSTPVTPLIKTPNYVLGEKDGCATAKGTYTKESALFRSDPDYEKGWFAGRQYCNPSFHKE